MNSAEFKMESINSLLGRTLSGLLAGSVIGAAIHLAFFWERPEPGEIKSPWQGALIGAVIIGLLSALVGARTLPRWFSCIVGKSLKGVIVGMLIGGLIFATAMTILFAGGGFHTKEFAMFRFIGVFGGAILGGAWGLLTGFGYWMYPGAEEYEAPANNEGFDDKRSGLGAVFAGTLLRAGHAGS